MAWYDYIPIAGSVTRLAQGNGGEAGEDLLKPSIGGQIIRTIGHGQGDAVASQEQGMDKARDDLNSLAASQKAFQMEGLNRAEGYYQPAMEELQSIYGKPGQFRK